VGVLLLLLLFLVLFFCLQENNNPINASQESRQSADQQAESELHSVAVRGRPTMSAENSESESRDESADGRLLNARLDVSLCLNQPW